jgi:hypothetical protein
MSLETRAIQIKNETQRRANTANRVGSLLEDMIKPYAGRLSYAGNGSTTITLVGGEAKQITGIWTAAKELNVQLNTDDIEVIEPALYKCYGMVTFAGKTGRKYEIQLRKNGTIICTCNPYTEVLSNRDTNLVSLDFTEFEAGDKLSLWFKSTASETIEVYRGKIVLTR